MSKHRRTLQQCGLKRMSHSLASANHGSCSVFKDKTIKLWKITERDKRPEGYNLKDEEGKLKDLSTVTSLQVRCHTRKVPASGKHIRVSFIKRACEDLRGLGGLSHRLAQILAAVLPLLHASVSAGTSTSSWRSCEAEAGDGHPQRAFQLPWGEAFTQGGELRPGERQQLTRSCSME